MKIGSGHKFTRMFQAPVSRFSILLAGFYSFMWGLWVFVPWWDVFNASKVYALLNFTGSEMIWGCVQMLVGIALILASFDSLRWIKWATFAGFVSWLLIAMSFTASAPNNPGMWVTGYIAATNAYFFLNFSERQHLEQLNLPYNKKHDTI